MFILLKKWFLQERQRGEKESCKLDMNIHSHCRWTWWNNQKSNLFCHKNSCFFCLCFWAWIKLLSSSPASSLGIMYKVFFCYLGHWSPQSLTPPSFVFSLFMSPFLDSLWKDSWQVINGVLTCDCCGIWRKTRFICNQEKAFILLWNYRISLDW